MPVRYIEKQKGYQYGKTGKVYTTKEYGMPGARVKAAKQGQAIEISEGIEEGRLKRQGNKIIEVHASNRARKHTREM